MTAIRKSGELTLPASKRPSPENFEWVLQTVNGHSDFSEAAIPK